MDPDVSVHATIAGGADGDAMDEERVVAGVAVRHVGLSDRARKR